MQPFGHNSHGSKIGGAVPPSRGGGNWVRIQHNVAWVKAYLLTKWHLDPSSRLGTIDMGRKLGKALPSFRGEGAGSPSDTMSLGLRPTCLPSGILIHGAIWPQQIWAKNGGLCPFGGGALGSHLTQCGQGRGLRESQISS